MRELKRWNPIKGTDGKTDRPMCEAMQNGTRCLQHCRNLIIEPNGLHGCLELDFKYKMMDLADVVIAGHQEIKDSPARRGRPPKIERES